jgi:hypothetical protein
MLEFINETVEITAAPEDNAVSQTGHPSARVPLQAPPAPQAFSASHRDVQVFAALHKIGADLGEPVEMREDGSRLLITGAGLSALQKQELRTSLSGISGVELRFEDANAKAAVAPSKSHGTEPTTAPPQLRLQALLGSGSSVEDFVNRVLDASDGMMARAHALRALAKAFPANTEAGMTPDDRSIVGNLRGEHASALKSRVDELGSILAPVIKTEAAGEGAASQPGSWQSAGLGVFSAAEGLDELLTRTLAGADRAADDEDFRRIAAALARLRTQLRAL